MGPQSIVVSNVSYSSCRRLSVDGGQNVGLWLWSAPRHRHLVEKNIQCRNKADADALKTHIESLKSITRHRNVVTILALTTDDTHMLYVYMPYYAGGDLTKHMEHVTCNAKVPRRPLLQERWQLMTGVWNGLRHLHGKNVLHGDLKPQNILVRVTKNGKYEAAIGDLETVHICTPGGGYTPNRVVQTKCWATAMVFNSVCDRRRDEVALVLITADYLASTPKHQFRWSQYCKTQLSKEEQAALHRAPEPQKKPHTADRDTAITKWWQVYSQHMRKATAAIKRISQIHRVKQHGEIVNALACLQKQQIYTEHSSVHPLLRRGISRVISSRSA